MFRFNVKRLCALSKLAVIVIFSLSCSHVGRIDQTSDHLVQADSNDSFQPPKKPARLELATGDPEYLETYKINARTDGGTPTYRKGHFLYNDLTIVCHVYSPKNPVGTVFLLHGYFDHAGSLNHAINAALQRGYAVFAYDLPGHGNSAGVMGDIRGIDNNARALAELLNVHGHTLPTPHYLVGFSTGGTIAIEYSRIANASTFHKIALVSPLIRHANWHWGRFAYRVFSPFKTRLKRMDKNNSSNTEYLNFAKTDPLRNSHLSLTFLADLYRWNDRISVSPPLDQSFLIVQGDADNVVDWAYNADYLSNNTSGSILIVVENAKHQLLNERKDIREAVFISIFDYFDNQIAHEYERGQVDSNE